VRPWAWAIVAAGSLFTGVASAQLSPTLRDPDAIPPRSTGPASTDVLVRVVAHGAMVIGDDVGGVQVTITEAATGRLLASGLQQGEAGDQNQIMRTPRLMEEPRYSTKPSAAFRATLFLDKPTLVEIAAHGPLRYPAAIQRASKTVLLVPGQDLSQDGIVLDLYGYLVHIEHPKPGEPLTAKDDVRLRATVRTLSGAWVRPHGDWDSRKVAIYAEVLVGSQVLARLQMFYATDSQSFETSFFVPTTAEAPDGVTLRVVAADGASGNAGMDQAGYPVLIERPPGKPR
jgi:hypothetical protein